MKVNEEIYCVRYNKIILKDDMHVMTYTIDVPVVTALGQIIPKSIILKEGKIIVTFDNKTRHVFFYNSDVELFIREIEKTKEDGEDVQAKSDKRSTRIRKDTK